MLPLDANFCGQRPNWDDYFLGLAKVVSGRSHDVHTKHGCVLVDQEHHIVGIGYNGFPRGLDDTLLPLNRPDKYPWMVHAEKNALCNMTKSSVGVTAYITGPPCFDCLIYLWQNGIKKIIHIDGYGYQYDRDTAELSRKASFISQSGIEVVSVRPDLSWLSEII